MKKLLLGLGAVLAMGLTACDDDPVWTITLDMANSKVEYNDNGVWKDCENPEVGSFSCSFLNFSHKAIASEWGVSWDGFCASRSTDNADHNNVGENLYAYQWGSMSKGGMRGEGTPFVIAYWSSFEGANPAEPSLKIDLTDGSSFAPQYIYVNNTSLTYYVMKEGNEYAKKFEHGDWCKVLFYGVTEDGKTTAPVEFYLADLRSDKASEQIFVQDWTSVDLKPLTVNGPIKYMYMQMESSDSGQWGMNTPGYFAIDGLQVIK